MARVIVPYRFPKPIDLTPLQELFSNVKFVSSENNKLWHVSYEENAIPISLLRQSIEREAENIGISKYDIVNS